MQDLYKSVQAEARHVASNPEHHVDDPSIFAIAWAAMKAGRGQAFNPARLRPMYLIDRPEPAPEPTEQTLERCAQKVRDYAEAKGYAVRRHAA